MGDKIINIFAVSNKKKQKPLFEFKKGSQSHSKKWFITKVEQDNQMMLKRLNDQPSCYDKKTWFKDFERNQGYKKNICIFPSIKFFKNTDYERNLHSSSARSSDNFYNNNNQKIRSKTSYQKFKNTNTFDKLYGSKYFHNTEDSSIIM